MLYRRSRSLLSLTTALLAVGALVLASGCDTDDGTGTNGGFNPLTDDKCDFGYADSGAGKGYGETCTTDSECRYGVCIAGDSSDGQRANLISQSFGYCSRGCDCGDTVSQLTDDEKAGTNGATWSLCMYPPGNNRRWAHVVVRCNDVSECQAIDPAWGRCAYPGTGVHDVCME